MCVTPVGSRPSSDGLEGLKSERKPQPCGPAPSPMDRCYGCLEIKQLSSPVSILACNVIVIKPK